MYEPKRHLANIRSDLFMVQGQLQGATGEEHEKLLAKMAELLEELHSREKP